MNNLANYGIYADYVMGKDIVVDVEKINIYNWESHYQSILNILKDMIESELVRTKKIGVRIGGKVIKLTFAHYMINMIFWNIIVKVGDTIKPEHLFFDNCIPGRTIENYINKLIIGPYREIIPLKTLNQAIADMIFNISFVDQFAPFFVNSVNLHDEVMMLRNIPDYKELIYPDLENVTLSESKSYGNKLIDKIQDYVKNSKKYIGYDHIYANAFRAKETINLKQLREFMGFIGAKPDGEGGVYPYIIPNSFITGGVNNNIAYFIESAGGRIAQILAKDNVGDAGYFARLLGLLAQESYLHEDKNYKCDTQNLIPITFDSKIFFDKYVDRWCRLDPKGFDVLITEDSWKDLKGKTVYLYSPATCASAVHGHGICYRCYGKLAHTNNNINIGKFAAELISREFTQVLLSAKHLLEVKLQTIEWPDKFNKYFTIFDNRILPKEEVDLSKVKIRIYKDSISEDTTDEEYDSIREEREDTDILNEYIDKFIIIDEDGGEEINIDHVSKFYLGDIFGRMVNSSIPDDDSEYFDVRLHVPKKNVKPLLNEETPLFFMRIQNNELAKTMEQAQRIINIASITPKFTLPEIITKFNATIIEGGLNVMSVHTEVIIANLVRAVDDIMGKPDWSYPEAKYQLLALSTALRENPSLIISLAYERIKDTLKNPNTFLKETPSSIDYYYMLNPQEFLNQEARDLSIDDTKKEIQSMFVKVDDDE